MFFKLLALLSLLAVSVKADESCETKPTIMCLTKAFFRPSNSIACNVDAATKIRDLTMEFHNTTKICSDQAVRTDAAKKFLELSNTIEKQSNKMATSCKNSGKISAFLCGTKMMWAYLKLTKNMNAVVLMGVEISNLEHGCFTTVAEKYYTALPNQLKQLRKCLFNWKPRLKQVKQ